MKTVIDAVGELGREVEKQYRRCNFDQGLLPEIAEPILADFGELDGISLDALATFIQETSLPQQPFNRFSDLPLTIFRTRDFYIELLVWSSSTTAIHQHSFSGAFRVILGSSIHTRYSFQSSLRISNDCLIGDICSFGSEALYRGDVRRIEPGITGLIHSLYHLDDPSISLVIRTSGHQAFGPQLNYYPPSLALHRKVFECDQLTLMLSRLLYIYHSANPEMLLGLWTNCIANLDFPKMCWIYLQHQALLEKKEHELFYEAAERVHGVLIEHLFMAAERYERQKQIMRLRAQIRDAELRFFLALLLNVPAKEGLLAMVGERFPDSDPINRCADWLTDLSVGEQGRLNHMQQLASIMASSTNEAITLRRQLRQALPAKADSDSARKIFRHFISAGDADIIKDVESKKQQDTFRLLAEIPLLRGLSSTVRPIKEKGGS